MKIHTLVTCFSFITLLIKASLKFYKRMQISENKKGKEHIPFFIIRKFYIFV